MMIFQYYFLLLLFDILKFQMIFHLFHDDKYQLNYFPYIKVIYKILLIF